MWIYLSGLLLTAILCFVDIKYIEKELTVKDLMLAILLCLLSYLGCFTLLIAILLDNENDSILWKGK